MAKTNMGKVFIIATIALCVLALCSCSCDYHLKKLENKCGHNWNKDTLLVHDSILVPSVQKDTIFHYSSKDTVIMKEGRLTVKYFYNTHDSTVYLGGKCDTVFANRFIKVAYEKEIIKPGGLPGWLFWLAIGSAVAFGAVAFIKK